MENDIEQGSALDIEKAKDILKTLNTEVRQNGSESHGSECCIYRVPNQLRNVNSKAYDPNLISIGPLHRENKGLEAMEKAKLTYFRKLTEQYGVDEKKMCDIVISIKNQEERLRNCYSEKSILMESSDDFVRMILLDAVFIILFFLETSNDDSDPKILEPWMTFVIREDLMLLENQIPLSIIQDIYDRVNPRSQYGKVMIPFLDLATCHFRKYSFLKRVETSPGVEGSRHFPDLLRNLMLGGASDFRPTNQYWSKFAPPFLSTRVLLKASTDKCLVNITFDKGVLTIPRLEVDHNFERRIRNIMALEQCCYSSEAYICSYMKLMDHLIDSAEDVGLLVRQGIIVHRLGDDAAVSNIINHLCEHIGDNYALFGLISGNYTRRYGRLISIRVPNQLRNVNSKAYDPNLISIGPLHRQNNGLEAMEKAKLNYFRKLTEQYAVDEKKIYDIVISIKNQEERLRNCYSEKSKLMESSEDFVNMILLDAVFIILFFLETSNDGSDPKILEPWMTFGIREDLMLLENQVPLFIIQEIYDRISSHSQDTEAIHFLDLASCHFIKESFLKRVETRHFTDLLGSMHFTDLLRNLMLGRVNRPTVITARMKMEIYDRKSTSVQSDKQSDYRPTVNGSDEDGKKRFTDLLRKEADLVLSTRVLKYSAVKLLKAGVRFEASKDKCLVNITFVKGVLKIPRLEIDHNFERRIRNIMALEQCCYSSEADICSYMKLMDHLIDSAEDVGLLVRQGIIVHRLGDDAAVSNIINHLCENIGYNYALFGLISRGLNAHYDNPRNHIKATLKLVYFPNIWRGTATVAAALLLILTFIQTLSSVKLFG